MILNPIDAVKFWLHWPQGYAFTDAELQEFLDLEMVMDADGILPGQTSYYVPTYDVMKAAGRGWMWLAGVIGNNVVMYRVGDLQVQVTGNYCRTRASDLMGSSCSTAVRMDEHHHDTSGRFRT